MATLALPGQGRWKYRARGAAGNTWRRQADTSPCLSKQPLGRNLAVVDSRQSVPGSLAHRNVRLCCVGARVGVCPRCAWTLCLGPSGAMAGLPAGHLSPLRCRTQCRRYGSPGNASGMPDVTLNASHAAELTRPEPGDAGRGCTSPKCVIIFSHIQI
jgi:hypothetical protein